MTFLIGGDPVGKTRRWALGLLFLAALGLALFGAAQGAPPDSVPPHPLSSVRDSPGWYPTVDPESMSVLLGRRTNAPLVSKPFKGGVKSLKEVGRQVCRMLHHRAADSLFALCVTEDEFTDIMWREFPQSRPATGLMAEDAWRVLYVRLLSGTRDATSDYGGRYYEFVRWERNQRTKDTTTVYKNFKLHNRLILVARRDDGQLERMNWLRSVAERKGRFKIYSTND
jgi:hypothetical protein